MTSSHFPGSPLNPLTPRDYPCDDAASAMLATLIECGYSSDEINGAFAKLGYHRLAALQPADQARDAARYRWLCSNNFDRQATQIQCWVHSWEPHSVTGEPTEWKYRQCGTLDAVIDNAMAEDAAIDAAMATKEAR